MDARISAGASGNQGETNGNAKAKNESQTCAGEAQGGEQKIRQKIGSSQAQGQKAGRQGRRQRPAAAVE
jgi:hypothetical protein